jgi:hypothetical protein
MTWLCVQTKLEGGLKSGFNSPIDVVTPTLKRGFVAVGNVWTISKWGN